MNLKILSFTLISLFLLLSGFLNVAFADTGPDLSELEGIVNLDEIKNWTNETLSNATNISEQTAEDVEATLDPIQQILDSIISIIQQIEELWWSLTGQN
ncbi:MAG: hypothetical protein ACP5C3_01225 [Methanomicrobiales archaeon]